MNHRLKRALHSIRPPVNARAGDLWYWEVVGAVDALAKVALIEGSEATS